MTLAEFSESIIKELIKPKTACTNSKPKSHPLTIIGLRNGKFIRRRCKSCYQVLSNNNNRENAQLRTKKTTTECKLCNEALCLLCYYLKHENL
ncbi:hypothetical protein A3Q56_04859 [Intoshia linei]|uniref:PiggyBac transposable element-derived protein 4 C-terminal zinc-ribbon domain-containing protein n=1 Tax=Intoshia linei TaxID=1819745 RepID=A0A177AZG9_9BILA|nr:hypothetical protein A3Q56_04859 [Intoshia linei]